MRKKQASTRIGNRKIDAYMLSAASKRKRKHLLTIHAEVRRQSEPADTPAPRVRPGRVQKWKVFVCSHCSRRMPGALCEGVCERCPPPSVHYSGHDVRQFGDKSAPHQSTMTPSLRSGLRQTLITSRAAPVQPLQTLGVPSMAAPLARSVGLPPHRLPHPLALPPPQIEAIHRSRQRNEPPARTC